VASAEDDKPIFSSRADDLDLRESIDQFVVGLAERVDRLQDADGAGRLQELAQLAGTLALESASIGFEPLSRCAERVHQSAREGQPRDAHALLIELSHLAQRVRRGHRGSL